MPSSTRASGQHPLPLRLFLVLPVKAGRWLLFPQICHPVLLPMLDADFGCLCSYPSSQLHCLHLIGKAKVLLSFPNA